MWSKLRNEWEVRKYRQERTEVSLEVWLPRVAEKWGGPGRH